MTFNRFALALLAGLLPGLAVAAAPNLQDASKLLHHGQSAQALKEVDGYLAQHATDPKARFLKGLILAKMNRTQEAIEVFSKLVADYPTLPEPYNNLAVLYASQGRYELARDTLEKAIHTNPTYATADENLGDIYAKMASQAYDKALKLDKSNTSAKMKLALVNELFTPTGVAKSEPVRSAARKPASHAAKTVAPANRAAKAAAPAKSAAPTTVAKASRPNKGHGQAADLTDATVRKMLGEWASAWSTRDVKAYLSHYAADFQPRHGMSRSAWKALRKRRLLHPKYIHISLYRFRIHRNGDRATAVFHEHYRSNLLNTRVTKSLRLKLQDGAWKIVSEK